MASWKIACVALGLLLAPLAAKAAETNCTACHKVVLSGVHAAVSCAACHGQGERFVADPASARSGGTGCTGCHPGHGEIFHQAMATREAEKAFVWETFGGVDPQFYQKNCASCHLSSCTDCHGNGHRLVKPKAEACHRCHKGDAVGADYFGRAPREDHLRYQRGPQVDGEAYLKMAPDVHFEAGLSCGDCHSMASLAAGRKAAKSCRDCHTPDPKVLEHRIGGHLEKLECYACHSAWGAQEYGTFFIRAEESLGREFFRVREPGKGEYLKSAYLKRQDAPPLGLNAAGRVSPIRPRYITYYTHTREDQPVGAENQLLAARWQAFFPHTVRRGTVLCRECHESPRRFLLEKAEDRIYLPDVDGLGLASFWDRQGQVMSNGEFFPAERFERMAKSPAYLKGVVEKWRNLLRRVGGSSKE